MTGLFRALKNYLGNRKLKFDILTSFFVLQVFTSCTIVFYTYQNNARTIVEYSDKMMNDLSDAKIDNIQFNFESIQTSIFLGSYIVRTPQEVAAADKLLLDYGIAVVRQYPFLESIFFGTESGIFLQVKKLAPGATYRSSQTKLLPKKASFAVRILDRTKEQSVETWSYLDAEGRVVETEKLPEFQVTFDHRVRDWYTKAMQTRSQIWTDIYIFSTTQNPGVATAVPMQNNEGKYFGVIGADVPLESFNSILKDLRSNGIFLVVTRKGEVVASTLEEKPIRTVGSEIQLTTVDDFTNKIPSLAYRQHILTGKEQFIFEHDNKKYVSVFRPFEGNLFKSWLFVSIIPLDELIGEIKLTQQKTLVMSFMILLVSVGLITLLAQRISYPIVQLAQQANRITHFDLSEPKPVHSGISEIQLLQNSISTMRRSLSSFGKFVPRSLVRKLIDKGVDVRIGGKNKKLTIFFSDIAGFTTVSETYPADRLMVHLSEYFEELTSIINTTNGTIDKYIGDAIMAFWGAPNSDRDHALHACQAALLCQRRLLDLNRKWSFEKKPTLNTRIGLHTGEVVVGNLGSSERMNYTIIGDSVNLAARLEGVNKVYHTNIIISDDVFHLVRDHAIVRPLDLVAVKGKNLAIKIYELVALQGADPLLVPTQEQLEFCRLFDRAFTHYQEQRWDEAIETFEKILHTFGKDYTTEMYIERCQYYKQNPPSIDWDGVHHLETK